MEGQKHWTHSVDNRIPKPYQLGKSLGKGTFGVVRLAKNQLTGENVAIKILEKSRIKDSSDVNRIKREINILKLMKHPNIIKLHDIIETPKQILLVMDYCEGGELSNIIHQQKRLDEKEAWRIYAQIIDALEYLARVRVVHRDLKPENILFDKNMNVKIVDFGLSNTWKHGERLKTACGSPCYAAPEMIAGKEYRGSMTDIWSSGIILYYMLCGHLPYEDRDTYSLYKKILNSNNSIPSLIPEDLSKECKNFLLNILNTDPRRRFGLRQIRSHAWFRDTMAKDLLTVKSNEDSTEKSDDSCSFVHINKVGTKPRTAKLAAEANKLYVKSWEPSVTRTECTRELSTSLHLTPESSQEIPELASVRLKAQLEDALPNTCERIPFRVRKSRQLKSDLRRSLFVSPDNQQFQTVAWSFEMAGQEVNHRKIHSRVSNRTGFDLNATMQDSLPKNNKPDMAIFNSQFNMMFSPWFLSPTTSIPNKRACANIVRAKKKLSYIGSDIKTAMFEKFQANKPNFVRNKARFRKSTNFVAKEMRRLINQPRVKQLMAVQELMSKHYASPIYAPNCVSG